MHVDIVPNRNSKPAILVRESYREGKKVKKRTIANVSFLSIEQAEALRLILKGKKLASVDELFEKRDSRLVISHDHDAGILTRMTHLSG